MIVVDSHCDSVEKLESGNPLEKAYNLSSENRHLQFFALFFQGENIPAGKAYERAKTQISLFNENKNGIKLIKSGAEIKKFVSENRRTAILSLERGEAVCENLDIIKEFYDLGLRVLNLTWNYPTAAASSNTLSGTEYDTGLSDFGRRLVGECERLGIILDLSHASDNTFRDMAEIAKKPFILSHSNFRDICPHKRNATREQTLFLIKKGSMIGLNLYRHFLSPSGSADISDIFRHINYALELGGENNIGFGFDIDGMDKKDYPTGISFDKSIHDTVIALLKKRYSGELAEKIAGGNYIEFLEKNLP